jgi:hypothetical protein
MANHPNAVSSFTTKSAGQTIQPSHINDAQDEIVAISTDLLKAWTSFTPTWTNLTAGNASFNTGEYLQIGKIVWFKIDLVWGSTTSISGSVSVNFPVAAATGASYTVAHGEAIDLSTSDAFQIHARLSSGTAMALFTDNGSKLVAVTSLVPFTWTGSGSADELHLVGFYEAA